MNQSRRQALRTLRGAVALAMLGGPSACTALRCRLGGSREPASFRLKDGRRLAWHEFGDPAGRACIYTTGTPASGVAGRLYHAPALQAGVRWISVDKPGYGDSDPQPGRRLLDWPRDVAAVADHLDLGRFTAAGESGGGPHALALAHGLPQRVTAVIVIAGLGPWHEQRMRDGMSAGNYRWFDLARREPQRLRQELLTLADTLNNPARRDEWLHQAVAAAPPADRVVYQAFPEVLEVALEAYRGALRAGPDAAAEELALLTRPWSFEPSDVRVPVDLWHGTEDRNAPVAAARDVAAGIPDCRARFIEGAGHCLHAKVGEIVAAMR